MKQERSSLPSENRIHSTLVSEIRFPQPHNLMTIKVMPFQQKAANLSHYISPGFLMLYWAPAMATVYCKPALFINYN
jgi:hypothetical protein